MRLRLLALTCAFMAPTLTAQEGEWPTDWTVRLDRAGSSQDEVGFEVMTPGWHLTTGPAGIFYNASITAEGEYRIESTIFLFDPGQRHREAYGILFGGSGLDGAEQAYSYFLIRDTGEFLIKKRVGGATETVVPWTASDAIMKYPGGDEQAKNTLAVASGADTVTFYINGESIASVPRSALHTDGV